MPGAKKVVKDKFQRLSDRGLLREAGRCEEEIKIENGPADFHRQVDAEGSLLARRQTLSARSVAPPPRKRLPADADANSSPSRIRGTHRPARDGVEAHGCRIFPDPAGEDHHRHWARRYRRKVSAHVHLPEAYQAE